MGWMQSMTGRLESKVTPEETERLRWEDEGRASSLGLVGSTS